MINKDAPYPLYRQVKGLLEEKIILGEWPQGYRIPTEKELANHYGVSTITVKRAVLDLVHEGLLFRQRGKGTFVTSQKDTDIQSLVTLKYEEDEGVKHPHKLLEFVKEPANILVSKTLEINPKDEVYKLSRVKLNGVKPVVLEHTYLAADLIPGLTEKMVQDELLYSVLQNKYGIELGQAKIYFSTLNANKVESNLLEVPVGERLFVLKRITRTRENRVIESSKFIVNEEDYRFYINVDI